MKGNLNHLNLALASKVLLLTVKVRIGFLGLYDFLVEEYNEDQHDLLDYDRTDTQYIIGDYCNSYHYIFKVIEFLKQRDNIKVLLENKNNKWKVSIKKGKKYKTLYSESLPLGITKCLLKLYL